MSSSQTQQREYDADHIFTNLVQFELEKYILEGDFIEVEELIDKHPQLARQANDVTGELPLHMLAHNSSTRPILMDKIILEFPEALFHRNHKGSLPLHICSQHGNVLLLQIIYDTYKAASNAADEKGRLPIHVAAEAQSLNAINFFLEKEPELANAKMKVPILNVSQHGGGIPLHVACRHYSSVHVITALLAENFESAHVRDENGELPLSLILRRKPDTVVVKTLLALYPPALKEKDINGDLPLVVALKGRCSSKVLNLLLSDPSAALEISGDGQSTLFLALINNAEDQIVKRLMEIAPELVTLPHNGTGSFPISVATRRERSHSLVYSMLMYDLPIDMNALIQPEFLPHKYSWNHIVSETDDQYYPVVSKLLQQECSQPQVVALAKITDEKGQIAIDTATPICAFELRAAMRIFGCLEITDATPAYETKDTQIFYALKYHPLSHKESCFPDKAQTLFEEGYSEKQRGDGLEDIDDSTAFSSPSTVSMQSVISNWSQKTIEEKRRAILLEKCAQVIIKITSKREKMEKELSVRQSFHLSRRYIPNILSIHQTIQHMSNDAADQFGYCIAMEGAETTLENSIFDMRRTGEQIPLLSLKKIGVALLHLHEHGLVHGDFGSHNVGKFRNRWKILGVAGSVARGEHTDPRRGFYIPPEAVNVDVKRSLFLRKPRKVEIVSIEAKPTFDIWAYGVMMYEIICGTTLSLYVASKGKKYARNQKIGKFGEQNLRKALKYVERFNPLAADLLSKMLQPDPEDRVVSMRDVLQHTLFNEGTAEFNKPEEDIAAKRPGMVVSEGTNLPEHISIVHSSEIKHGRIDHDHKRDHPDLDYRNFPIQEKRHARKESFDHESEKEKREIKEPTIPKLSLLSKLLPIQTANGQTLLSTVTTEEREEGSESVESKHPSNDTESESVLDGSVSTALTKRLSNTSKVKASKGKVAVIDGNNTLASPAGSTIQSTKKVSFVVEVAMDKKNLSFDGKKSDESENCDYTPDRSSRIIPGRRKRMELAE